MPGSSLRTRARASESRLLWSAVAAGATLLARVTGAGRWELRRGHALERLGHHRTARRAYARAAGRPHRRPEWLLPLARAHERAGDWAAAALARAEAVALAPDRVDWHGPLLGALERIDDPVAAVPAHQRALGALGEEHAPPVRSRLAELHDRLGDWEAARRLLQANVSADPGDAAGHRRLARAAERLWTWGGRLEGGTRGLEAVRFRALAPPPPAPPDPRGAPAPTGGDPGAAYLQLARDALERAVELEPARWAWRGALGELREATGDLDGAIACYAAMVEREATSDRRAAFRARHEWEFALERARHRAGAPRVEDPLFDAGAVVAADEHVEPGPRPPGLFDVRWTFGGLAVTGFVTSRRTERVEVVLDDQVLRTVNVAGGSFLPRFGQAIQRDALAHAPREARLRVRTPAGEGLVARGRARAVDLSVPHGTGRLARILGEGGRLDKKGGISAIPAETRARQDAYLRLYDAVRPAFEAAIGPLLLIHGTLLGQHREGDLIPGDDDFDVAYVSRRSDPVAVKEEAKGHMLALVDAGFTVSFNRSGRLFRVGPADGDAGLHLDVHPVWFEGGRAWLHNDVSIPADVGDFLPPAEARLRGTRVHVPRRPEVFLEGHYGPGWRVPDPGFMNHRSEVAPAVLAHLARALITPAEYRELEEEVRRRCGPEAARRLVSIGSRPLYPLDDAPA